MVKLEAKVSRFIGLSTDQKPGPRTDGTEVEPGSSFLETDTGKIFRFSGTGEGWTYYNAKDEQLAVLRLIYVEIVQLRQMKEIELGASS